MSTTAYAPLLTGDLEGVYPHFVVQEKAGIAYDEAFESRGKEKEKMDVISSLENGSFPSVVPVRM